MRQLSLWSALILFLISPLATGGEGGRVREQWFDLAPLISMDNEVSLVELDAKAVGQKLAKVHQYANMSFDADPLLHEVGPGVVKYLLEREARIIPILRARDFDAEQLLAEVASRVVEKNVEQQWRLSDDRRFRADYGRLMPIARRVAAGQNAGANALELRVLGKGMQVRNSSGKNLTGATLALKLKNVFGNVSEHYYFLSRWDAGDWYTARIASDWQSVGTAYTTAVNIELLSDQVTTAPVDFTFKENETRAIQLVITEARRIADRNPPAAKDLLNSLKTSGTSLGDMAGEIERLLGEVDGKMAAYAQTVAQIERLQTQLKERTEARVRLSERIRSETDRNRRQTLQANLAAIDKQIARIRGEIAQTRR